MAEQKKDAPRLQTLNYDPVLFHNDEQLYFVYKKIEAISGAVFLITHSIKDTEVIKSTLREQSIKTMNQMVGLISKTSVDVTDVQNISSSVTYINSLLDIAFWSGVVSQMNVSLIQREIAQVYKVVNNLIAKYKDTFFLDSDFFSVKDIEAPTASSSQEKEVSQVFEQSSTPLQQNQSVTPNILSEKPQQNSKPIQSKGQINNTQDLSDKINKRQIPAVSVKDNSVINNLPKVSNTERRDTIIKLVEEKGTVGIKDVSIAIPLVSEKTIQRELLALVSEGILKKEGERRWSTYSLI